MSKEVHKKDTLANILERAELRLSILQMGSDCSAILHQLAVVERLQQLLKEANDKCMMKHTSD